MDYNNWFKNEFPQITLNPPGSIYADTAFFLVNFIRKNKPKRILELGSGVSTAVMGLEINKYQGELVSLEHDEEYIKHAKNICNFAGFTGHNIIHAPLKKMTFQNEKEFSCYDQSVIPKNAYDFVFIDGPPGFKSNHPGRRGTLYLIWEMLTHSSQVLLDDGDRQGEKDAVMEWMTVFGSQLLVKYHQFEKPGFEIQINKSK